MKMYIAYTGGTIGMEPSEQGLVPGVAFPSNLKETLKALGLDHDIDIFRYESLIDSSNATPKDWMTVARDLSDRWDDYDAFIILHGTDTMAYTSAALFFMLQNADKPVVVTGSQVPMYEARSDALNNILGAVSACENGPNGVFLYFGGKLIEGDRAHKSHTSNWQAFSSPNFLERGILGIDWQWRPRHVSKAPMSILIPEMLPGAVTILPVFPGVTAEHWHGLLGEHVKGAVLLSYGAGNAPETPELISFLKQATDRGVCIVNVSQCGQGNVMAGSYAAGSALIKAGVVSGKDMTYEAAFARLHFLIGMGEKSNKMKELFS